MKRVVYTSLRYRPVAITHRYVRHYPTHGDFRVYECGPHPKYKSGGATLREYDTDGEEIPQSVRDAALAAPGRMVEWKADA